MTEDTPGASRPTLSLGAGGVNRISTCELIIPADLGRLSDEVEVTLFRIVQECLTNIHRHSGSKTAAIRLSRTGESVSLEIQDEGKGIPAERLAEIQDRRTGVGITGMRERVRHLKGAMDIESNANGTKISVTLPVGVSSASGARRI